MDSRFILFCWMEILTIGFQSVSAHAQLDDANWNQVFQFNREGKWQQAIDLLKKNQENDPNYFYNLGTLYLKTNNLGQSVAFLERARKLSPRDPWIRKNLEIARNSLGKLIGQDRIEVSSGSMLDWPQAWVESWKESFPKDQARGLLGLLVGLLSVLWLWTYRRFRGFQKTLKSPVGLLSLAFFLIVVPFAFLQETLLIRTPAICIDPQAIRSGPGEKYLEVSQLLSGVKVRLSGSVKPVQEGPENWRLIYYGNGSVGWVRERGLMIY